MKAHPAAELFPMMAAADFAALRDDIAEHGLRDPVIVYKGQLLDGRNRHKACEELGVEVDSYAVDDHDIGGDPVAYVISANLRRRHLTEGQRGMVALELEKLYAKDAKERMLSGKKTDPVAPVPQGKSRDKAAAAMQVGSRTVSSCKKVDKAGAKQVADAVRGGTVSPKVAESLVKTVPDKKQQAAILSEAIKTAEPDKAIRKALAPKNPLPIYATTDRVLNAIEHFAATMQWVFDEFGSVSAMLAHESWDKKETEIFRQHVNALPTLLGDIKKELANGK